MIFSFFAVKFILTSYLFNHVVLLAILLLFLVCRFSVVVVLGSAIYTRGFELGSMIPMMNTSMSLSFAYLWSFFISIYRA